MELCDYLDKGAALGAERPCLTMAAATLSYGAVQALSHRIARSLHAGGIAPGSHVAVLSANDPLAFACVFGISRAGCTWVPINPRNAAAENGFVLDAFDCDALIVHPDFAAMAAALRPGLPKLKLTVGLDEFDRWLDPDDSPVVAPPPRLAMLPGTGGTTGSPKGVMLPASSIEAMSAAVLMRYPFVGRPTYLAMAPLTHAAGVMAFPCLALGGHVVVMPRPDLGDYLALVERHRATHSFLPPTLIYMLLDHPDLPATDLSSLQCLWYGAAPISPARLAEACDRLGPMAQIFGQTEAPMMISTMSPADHRRPDGSLATERLSSAGRPSPLVQVAIVDGDGAPLPCGERGEIVVRGSLVMMGYYKNPVATADATTTVGVAPHRRHRLPRYPRLSVHRRPRQGHDHLGRLQRLLERGRGGAAGAPGGAGRRRLRPARRQMGRARLRGGAAARRRGGDARGDPRGDQGQPRQRQDAQAARHLARSAALQDRQGAQA